MIFRSLASSSFGNAYVVEDAETRILLECGLTVKKLQRLSDFSLASFGACLVSHEHKDHAKSVGEIAARGVAVYMSPGTADALGLGGGVELVEHLEQFSVGTLDIVPFTTFHDAAEPLGFLVKSRIDGDVLAFATDTVNLRYKFPGLSILAVEANYDAQILERSERLPEKVRRRITNSHMEIGTLCEYLSQLDLSRCREIYLLHLSDAMSRENEFVRRVRAVVPKNITITVCDKEKK
ncbi:MAG: MBL fold metallo-hydrolase [Clostridia bacterium]|nr:MBL fold metallo-hydrolase [Clostridia bacterium]